MILWPRGACSVKHGLGREESGSFYSARIFKIFRPVFFQLRERDTDILPEDNKQKYLFGIIEVYACLCVFKILCTGCKVYSSCTMDWIAKEKGFFSIYLLWKMILGWRINQEKGKEKEMVPFLSCLLPYKIILIW